MLPRFKHRPLGPHIYCTSHQFPSPVTVRPPSARERPYPESGQGAGHMMMRHSMFCFSASTMKPSLPANLKNDLHTSRAPMRIDHLHEVPALGRVQPKSVVICFSLFTPCRFEIEILRFLDKQVYSSRIHIYYSSHPMLLQRSQLQAARMLDLGTCSGTTVIHELTASVYRLFPRI